MYTLPSEKRNYDDINEAFWRVDNGLIMLRTKSDAPGGRAAPLTILDELPSVRYELLLHADWEDFFKGVRKSHVEYRSWSALLSANRRIFLLHGLAFGALACVEMDLYRDAWDYNGWGSFAVLPYLMILPPLSRFFGRLFAWRATPNDRQRAFARLRLATFHVIVAIVLLVVVVYFQSRYLFEAFEALPLRSVDAGVVIASIGLQTFHGLAIGVDELFVPPTPPPGQLDANLAFEQRTRAALAEQSWLVSSLPPAGHGGDGNAAADADESTTRSTTASAVSSTADGRMYPSSEASYIERNTSFRPGHREHTPDRTARSMGTSATARPAQGSGARRWCRWTFRWAIVGALKLYIFWTIVWALKVRAPPSQPTTSSPQLGCPAHTQACSDMALAPPPPRSSTSSRRSSSPSSSALRPC